VLRLEPVADVADVCREDRVARELDGGDRELDGEGRAVGSHRLDFDATAQHGTLAGGEVSRDPAAVLGPRVGRDDQLGHLPPDDLRLHIPEGPFGGGVPLAHRPVVIDRDDGVERGTQDRAR
jgi:hypothetical protein